MRHVETVLSGEVRRQGRANPRAAWDGDDEMRGAAARGLRRANRSHTAAAYTAYSTGSIRRPASARAAVGRPRGAAHETRPAWARDGAEQRRRGGSPSHGRLPRSRSSSPTLMLLDCELRPLDESAREDEWSPDAGARAAPAARPASAAPLGHRSTVPAVRPASAAPVGYRSSHLPSVYNQPAPLTSASHAAIGVKPPGPGLFLKGGIYVERGAAKSPPPDPEVRATVPGARGGAIRPRTAPHKRTVPLPTFQGYEHNPNTVDRVLETALRLARQYGTTGTAPPPYVDAEAREDSI